MPWSRKPVRHRRRDRLRLRSVRNDLSILPAEVIHSVVQYYRAARQSNLLTRDLRDPSFLTQIGGGETPDHLVAAADR